MSYFCVGVASILLAMETGRASLTSLGVLSLGDPSNGKLKPKHWGISGSEAAFARIRPHSHLSSRAHRCMKSASLSSRANSKRPPPHQKADTSSVQVVNGLLSRHVGARSSYVPLGVRTFETLKSVSTSLVGPNALLGQAGLGFSLPQTRPDRMGTEPRGVFQAPVKKRVTAIGW